MQDFEFTLSLVIVNQDTARGIGIDLNPSSINSSFTIDGQIGHPNTG